MIDQTTFDRAEAIADSLHEQRGLTTALISYLDGKLDRGHEAVVYALIQGQERNCARAMRLAAQIAKSEPEAVP